MLIEALLFTEVFSMCTAAFFLFQKKGNTFAESASYAVIAVFLLRSFIRQISFVTGMSLISGCMEAVFVIVSFVVLFRYRTYAFGILSTLKRFGSENTLSFVFLGGCFFYIFVHAFLQFGSNLDGGHFCFLAYMSIGFSTYALSRRYSWPTTAFTTAILVLSMPRLVFLAACPDTEIISIAVALFCILALYRSVEEPSLTDLILLILGIFWGMSETVSGMIFAPILFFLSGVVLFRRHGFSTWKSILRRNHYVFFALVPAAISPQCWLFLSPYFNKGAGFVGFSGISFNNDGIQGALANFFRYLFESLYFTAPVDMVFEKVIKWSMAHRLQSLYEFCVIPFLGESGAAQAFHLTWLPGEMLSFGPVGFFMVLPALCHALFKGPRRLKSVALGFFVYFYLVCLILAWAPGNARFLGIFYVCSGFTVSFFLPPWRLTRPMNTVFQTGGCILLLLTLLAAC